MGLIDLITSRFRSDPPAKPVFGEVAISDPDRLFFEGVAPYNPSVLVQKKGLYVFDKMRADDQIKAALALKKNAITATGWEVVAPEGRPDDWEPVAFVRDALERLEGTFEDDLLEILSALDYGYSVTEKVWTEDGAHVTLAALKTRKPHAFDFEADEFGNLRAVIQDQGREQRRLSPAKFVIYTYQGEFDNWYGRSDLESAYRAWWSKDNAYKWLAMLLERHGIPPIFALYSSSYSKAQVTRLKQVIERIQAATFGVIPRPKKDDLELWSTSLADNAAKVFIPALEMYNQDIARAILMPGLLGMSPDKAVGSYARARVHFDVFMLTVERIRREIEAVINEQLVRELVLLNFPVDEVPRWRFLPLSDDTRLDILERWTQLVSSGVVKPQPDDERHVRAMLKFPERDVAEDEAPPQQATKSEDTTPRTYTVKVDYAQIERNLDGVEAESRSRIVAALENIRNRLIGVVTKAEKIDEGFVKKTRLAGFRDVETALRDTFAAALEHGREDLRDEIGLPRKHRQHFTPRIAVRYLDTKAIEVSGVLRDKLLGDVKMVLLNHIKSGEPLGDTIRKLKEVFEPYVGDPTTIRDEKLVEPYRLETIIRTNVTEAYNQGRIVEMLDPEVKDMLSGVQYSAVIDTRTTEVCRLLHGKVFDKDDPELHRLAPPNHFNCRSVLVPVLIDETVDEKEKVTPAVAGRARELAGKGFV